MNNRLSQVEDFTGTESDSDITSVSRMIPNNVGLDSHPNQQPNTYEGLELTYTIDGKSFFHGRIDRRLAESKLYNAGDFLLRTPASDNTHPDQKMCLSVLDDNNHTHHLLLSQREVTVIRENYRVVLQNVTNMAKNDPE